MGEKKRILLCYVIKQRNYVGGNENAVEANAWTLNSDAILILSERNKSSEETR